MKLNYYLAIQSQRLNKFTLHHFVELTRYYESRNRLTLVLNHFDCILFHRTESLNPTRASSTIRPFGLIQQISVINTMHTTNLVKIERI